MQLHIYIIWVSQRVVSIKSIPTPLVKRYKTFCAYSHFVPNYKVSMV